MIKAAIQTLITITSAMAIVLITSPDPAISKLGFVVGLIGQPAWVWCTYQARQWGMFLVSMVFLYSYLRGLYPSLPGIV